MRQLLPFLISLIVYWPAYSQNVDYDSAEQLVNDLRSRNFAKPITFMEHQLDSIEKNSKEVFPDSIYIGMVDLLAAAYVHTNRIYEADTLLNHSINYMAKTGRKSPLSYSLFVSYGGILSRLQNYDIASTYLKSALEILSDQNDKGENYALVMSMLANCHLKMDSLALAKKEIDESIFIIENVSSRYALSNKMGIYQKAGAIYHELGLLEKAEDFTKQVYNISKGDDIYVTEFINAANNLSILYLNNGNYLAALEILHEIEKKPLSETEKANVYNSIFLANYFLNNEEETVKYAALCSNSLMVASSELHASFPTLTLENLWEKSIMQLKVNMGILDKFSNNKSALEMCYNNAIFVKSLVLDNMERLRKEASKNKEIGTVLQEIQRLKAERFSGNPSAYKELNNGENRLITLLKMQTDEQVGVSVRTWKDVRHSLGSNEYAIEFVTFLGFTDSVTNQKELRYAALIVSPEIEYPHFVELCSFSQLNNVIIKALKEQEIGINSLYLKESEVLYRLLWENIEPYVMNAKTIYVSPVLDIQNINIGFIPCPNNYYVNDRHDVRIVTSTSEICNQQNLKMSEAAIWGGIEYSREKDTPSTYRGIVLNQLNDTLRGDFGYLHSSFIEVDSVKQILEAHRIQYRIFKGKEATETSLREFDGNSPSILHFSTHGFYLVGFDKYLDYFGQLLSVSHQDNSMLFSGLLLADANKALNGLNENTPLNDGVITAEEISMMDFSNTDIVVLSACETGIGIHSEGYGGLIRAFKMAGAKHIVGSLWKVSDSATSKLMTTFYNYLTSGNTTHEALLKAQRTLALQYPDPYYWAAFIVLE